MSKRPTDKRILEWLMSGHLEIKNRWLVAMPTRADLADLMAAEKAEKKAERRGRGK